MSGLTPSQQAYCDELWKEFMPERLLRPEDFE